MENIINKTSLVITYPFGGMANKIIKRYKPSTIILTSNKLIVKYWGLLNVITIPLKNIKNIENIDSLTWKKKNTLLGGAGGISFSFGPASFSKIPVKNGIVIKYKNDKNKDREVLITALNNEKLKPLKIALNNLKSRKK